MMKMRRCTISRISRNLSNRCLSMAKIRGVDQAPRLKVVRERSSKAITS